MHYFMRLLLLGFPLLLSSCQLSSDLRVKDPIIRDRIFACSAGMSQEAITALKGAYERQEIKGTADVEFQRTAQAIIFSVVPPEDRLKAYEAYIHCIEGRWNEHTSACHGAPLKAFLPKRKLIPLQSLR